MQKSRVIALASLNLLLSIFGTVMNSLVAFVILKNKNLQKGLNLLILSLSTADLLNCVVAQPMYVHAILYCTDEASTFQLALMVVALITLHASTANLLVLTLYRWRALSLRFAHHLLLSKKQVLIAITVVWLLSICAGVFFATSLGKLVSPYLHLAMILTWVAGYIGLFRLVQKRKRKIASLEGSPTSQFQTASLEYENEAVKTSAILVGSSLICFLPDLTFEFMGRADENRLAWVFTVLFLSSCLNPCLFIWRSHHFRTALGKAFHHFPRDQK